jgi:hypothetical protein
MDFQYPITIFKYMSVDLTWLVECSYWWSFRYGIWCDGIDIEKDDFERCWWPTYWNVTCHVFYSLKLIAWTWSSFKYKIFIC